MQLKNPDNADVRFNLAMLGSRNQLDAALAHLRRVIEINPRNADAHRNLAVGLGLAGKTRGSHPSQPDEPSPPACLGRAQGYLNALLKAAGKATSP